MGMLKQSLATAAIGVALIGAADAQRSSRYPVVEESDVSRTLNFSAASGGGRILDVRNTHGFIHVEGTTGSAVQMTIHKVVRGETSNDVAEGQRDVRLEFKDGAPRIEATVYDRRGRYCGEERDGRDGDRNWDRVHYDVQFDFTVKVPRDVTLRLCTVNGGDVIVSGTQGDFDVANVNGPIAMNRVGGSGRAHTVNGAVTVTFTANPKLESSFKTVNGNVDVQFLDGLSAVFAMKTMNGGLFTDFDVQPLPSTMTAAPERKDGRFTYRANQSTRVRVGSGGPQITFETLNGNVRARRAGGRTP
jgi:hypothetical protein